MSEQLAAMASEVSVIVPAYHAADTIERALRSVVGQTLVPMEVVVVDDGSTDATFDAAEACRDLLAPIDLKVIRQENAGAGAARNRAIENASGKYLAFLDADDDWLSEHLEKSLRRLDEDGLTLCAHNEWLVTDGVESLNDSARRIAERPDPVVSVYRKGCISTSTVVTHRAAVLAAGGFDPTLTNGQDVDLWLAIISHPGATITVFDEPLSRYYRRPGSIDTHIARRFRFFLQIARRWSGEIARRRYGGLSALWFRMAAIHYAALRGLLSTGQVGPALIICLRLPLNIADVTIRRFAAPLYERPNFLVNPEADQVSTPGISNQQELTPPK